MRDINTIWEPQDVQAVALACPARELLYGGSKGSAKSSYLVACVLPILKLAQEKYEATGKLQRHCRIIYFRKNLEDLKDLIAKMFDIYPAIDPEMGHEGYHRVDKTWQFTSGATIELRHLAFPGDHLGYSGHAFVAMLFDEVQQIPYDAYSFLTWQVRSGDPDYHAARMIRCTANPGGEGWVTRHFKIDEYPQGGKVFGTVVTNSDGSKHEITRAFVRARTSDNKYLPADYEAQMRASMTADEVAMYIDGDFGRVVGAFFSALLRPDVHFQMSRPIPDSWTMRYAIDWGSSSPACCVVGAEDNDGCLWIIDELHQPGITGHRYGEALQGLWQRQAWCSTKKWARDEFWGLIDKQAMDQHNGPATAGAGIMECGFRIFEADKDRQAGCNQLKERLLMDHLGKPRMVIFSDRCPNVVAALNKIRSDQRDVSEYDPSSEYSHAADALRFLAVSFPVRNARQDDPVDEAVRQWDAMLARRRERATQNDHTMTGGYDG